MLFFIALYISAVVIRREGASINASNPICCFTLDGYFQVMMLVTSSSQCRVFFVSLFCFAVAARRWATTRPLSPWISPTAPSTRGHRRGHRRQYRQGRQGLRQGRSRLSSFPPVPPLVALVAPAPSAPVGAIAALVHVRRCDDSKADGKDAGVNADGGETDGRATNGRDAEERETNGRATNDPANPEPSHASTLAFVGKNESTRRLVNRLPSRAPQLDAARALAKGFYPTLPASYYLAALAELCGANGTKGTD